MKATKIPIYKILSLLWLTYIDEIIIFQNSCLYVCKQSMLIDNI